MTAPGSSRDADRRFEDVQREMAALAKLLEATRTEFAELKAEVVDLRAQDPWWIYPDIVAHYNVGHRTAELWKAEGMPMEERDGRCKGRRSEIQRWVREHKGYLPVDADGGSDVQAA